MNFEDKLKQAAQAYSAEGYEVKIHPQPEDLPPFAKDFKVEIVGKQKDGGVIVSIKQNRDDLVGNTDIPYYAEVTNSQPGWRFDLGVLESGSPTGKTRRDARELPVDKIITFLLETEQMVKAGHVRFAIIGAWSALEAAMRLRLEADGQLTAGRSSLPRQMLNELYSSGVLNEKEFRELEKMLELRNRIVHGFDAGPLDPLNVEFLADIARRLLEESAHVEKQPA